ncbi:MAG: 16S rRNA (uracil(1498)-N(3))-methyltransferase [Lachnospiraceae bacterium]|jgi:16S rRNA (uracil1498-N3)-methyltransferase|nr:16S rRNA (uracil(1498)-N(3))-methyltransferase [Lachnospiraceae bacterium]
MYRFFIDPEQLNNEYISISGDDYNHIRNVLRMKVGENVLLSDGSDREYEASIVEYVNDGGGDAAVSLKITDVYGQSRELPAKITLFQGYPKGDKMEQIIQKAVELGAFEVVPVMMNRCVVKLDEKKASKKVERLNTIALSAAKQSKRGIVPEVKPVMSMKEALSYAKELDYVIIPYECAEGVEYSKKIISEAVKEKKIGVFIGPEGGFDTSEIETLSDIGGKIITLGNRILRTETAGMTVLSILMFSLEQ